MSGATSGLDPLVRLSVLEATLLASGFALPLISSSFARPIAWLLALGATGGAHLATAGEAPLLRLVALCLTLFLGMKGVAAVESVAAGETPLPFRSWLRFAALWIGMQPRLFSAPRSGVACPGTLRPLRTALPCMAAGALLLALARQIAIAALPEAARQTPATLLAMVGLVLFFHFGLFGLVAAAWRARGVPAGELMRAPYRSRTLREFWGRRWNVPFIEMSTLALYRPLGPRLGPNLAGLAVFLVSGLFHEVAISLPVSAGFGLPTAYFVLHGGLVLAEDRYAKRLPPLVVRALAFVALLGPTPLLFHGPFRRGIVWPLAGLSGG